MVVILVLGPGWPDGHRAGGHNYIGHNYVGNNYIGHNYTGHNYWWQMNIAPELVSYSYGPDEHRAGGKGHNYIGHKYVADEHRA